MKAFVVLGVLAVAIVANGLPMAKEESVMDKFMANLRDCVEAETTSLCLKEKTMKYTDNIAAAKEIKFGDFFVVTNTGSPRSARSHEALPEDATAREAVIEDRILDNIVDFLEHHTLTLRMPKSFTEDNSVDEEGRGKKKKKLKKLLPIIALLKLKLAALVPLFLGIIAFAVFKAYLLGKIAFIAAAFGALKKLLESKKSGGGGGWSEPAHEEHGWESGGGGGGGGWGRSQEAQALAYAGHAKQQ